MGELGVRGGVMLLMGWVGMGRSIRSRFLFSRVFNMGGSICIGTAKELEHFNIVKAMTSEQCDLLETIVERTRAKNR